MEGQTTAGATLTIRCIYMLLALYERPRTVADLLDYLTDKQLPAVSRRSIQRNLEDLEGYFGLYRKERSALNSPDVWDLAQEEFERLLELEDPVALALVIAQQQLQELGPVAVFAPVTNLFERARDQLAARSSTASLWLKRVRVSAASHRLIGPDIDPAQAQRLLEVALKQVAVRLHYHPHQGDPEQVVRATALAVFYRGAVAYLIIRDHSDDRVRQLPFSRISEVREIITEPARVKNFDLDDYAASGALAFRYGEPFLLEAIVFNSVRREIEDAPLGEKQELLTIPDQPNCRLLRVEVPYTLNLIQWLMARAAYLKVVAPTDFRDKFQEELRRALQNFESDKLEVPKQRNFGG
ncbi:helix-turn-helix transcriptional regulator [Pseudidiomarina sp. E22-M8]|uniref:helix-turn-helix transcriptional regulator n=1 Tax=Pseudidiomarina sp. E22-M8 TaxID=3424768 RepID=UPI00403C2D60